MRNTSQSSLSSRLRATGSSDALKRMSGTDSHVAPRHYLKDPDDDGAVPHLAMLDRVGGRRLGATCCGGCEDLARKPSCWRRESITATARANTQRGTVRARMPRAMNPCVRGNRGGRLWAWRGCGGTHEGPEPRQVGRIRVLFTDSHDLARLRLARERTVLDGFLPAGRRRARRQPRPKASPAPAAGRRACGSPRPARRRHRGAAPATG